MTENYAIDVFTTIQSSESFSNFDFRWLSFLTVDDQNQVTMQMEQQVVWDERLDKMSLQDRKVVTGSNSVVAHCLHKRSIVYVGISKVCKTCGMIQ